MKNLYVVLGDGESFTSIDGCEIIETTDEGEEALKECSDNFFRDSLGEDEEGNPVIHIRRRVNIKALLAAFDTMVKEKNQ